MKDMERAVALQRSRLCSTLRERFPQKVHNIKEN